jgi:hypothetical protein
MLDNGLMPVFHERGIQIRLADREGLNQPLRGRNGRRLKQHCHSPTGNPGQSFDQFVVNEDDILTGGLKALQVSKGEWITERNGGPRCSDGQSDISWTNLYCWW